VLETLRAYRDPLILFYRNGDSTAEVADALELSEETVRQRLSRGRGMLNERVARLVETGLRRSNPAKAFTIAVLAALPTGGAQAAMAWCSSDRCGRAGL
jgi:zinc protease